MGKTEKWVRTVYGDWGRVTDEWDNMYNTTIGYVHKAKIVETRIVED